MATTIGARGDIEAEVRAATAEALPHPGTGGTWERFAALAEIARADLSVAKLAEPHHDATAILQDLGGPAPRPGSLWGVWAAEPPFAKLTAVRRPDWCLDGTKAFCSGATMVSDALVTAETDDGPRLFAVDMDQARADSSADVADPDWVGPGMRAADTRTVHVHHLPAEPVGPVRGYLDRPGFWHGAAGIAACWLGGAQGLALPLRTAADKGRLDGHGLAHLGAVTALLDAARAHLLDVARRIDAAPDDTTAARRWALSVRATLAGCVEQLVVHVGRALGPGPLAFDADHARRQADLQVFIRQQHAERDLAELGDLVRAGGEQR
ncbi:MAG TPA: acyl-CoA dehydrogenase [Nocardioidaceae bacterium]|nr:acyl-CoA dehydrogenase [Nocardioidaceae bacterium]